MPHDDLLAGEGKVLPTERVALYRDPQGLLHATSSVCPHRGCDVEWNREEKVWDCPCHGSRFSPAGEVLRGPAVRPLAPVGIPEPLPPGVYTFPLEDRREVAEETMAFRFDTRGSGFLFEAGQNADFTLIDPPSTDAEGNGRTFSMASSPHHRDHILVTTRMRPTAFKNNLRSLPLGTRVRVTGPNGDMLLPDEEDTSAVFLAGGIGITPFRSMIEWATETGRKTPLYLFYANRTRAATAFLDDLEGWARRNPNLRLIPTIDAAEPGWGYETGRIDAAMLDRHLSGASEPMYFLAGPPGMVAGMRGLLTSRNVGRGRIREEAFSGY